MSIDTRIWLPESVQIRDVGNVMGILAGLPFEKRSFGDGKDCWYVDVAGVSRRGIEVMPECAEIYLRGSMVDGETNHFAMYYFESVRVGYRLLMPRSTPFWKAIGRGLVDFFGGEVDYNDCDDIDVDYSVPNQYPEGFPLNNGPWREFQEKMANIKPLIKGDLI